MCDHVTGEDFLSLAEYSNATHLCIQHLNYRITILAPRHRGFLGQSTVTEQITKISSYYITQRLISGNTKFIIDAESLHSSLQLYELSF